MDDIQVVVKNTEELTSKELVNVFYERTRVFVVEQNCAYQEVDNKDESAIHVILKKNEKLVAYARIIPSDDNRYMSFGRVLVPEQYRGLKLGHKLVTSVLETLAKNNPKTGVKIAGQEYLKNFYSSFGLVPVSDTYKEDGIPHVDMVMEADQLKKFDSN